MQNKTITNINIGLCHRRTQEGKPVFFVNWQENGENNYKFFLFRFEAERLKEKLTKNQTTWKKE